MSQVLEKNCIVLPSEMNLDTKSLASSYHLEGESTGFVPNEANAIRLRFLPSQQGQFAPVEWDEIDEEIFDV